MMMNIFLMIFFFFFYFIMIKEINIRNFFCKIECWVEVFFYVIIEYFNLVREKIKFLFRVCYSRFDCYRWLLSLIRKSEKIDENENIIYRIRSFFFIILYLLF